MLIPLSQQTTRYRTDRRIHADGGVWPAKHRERTRTLSRDNASPSNEDRRREKADHSSEEAEQRNSR